MRGDAGELARDGAVQVLDDGKVRGEEDVEEALVDLQSKNSSQTRP